MLHGLSTQLQLYHYIQKYNLYSCISYMYTVHHVTKLKGLSPKAPVQAEAPYSYSCGPSPSGARHQVLPGAAPPQNP